MAWLIDALVGLGVIAAFIYLIYARLVHKYPKLREALGPYSPTNLVKDDKTRSKEIKKQTWTENRATI